MAGPMDFMKNADYWQQDRWTGQFPVIWHIVKDVPNIRHILLENNDNKPVTHSRDSQECLVKGFHKRLHIFHTIEFSNGGADIQILWVVVYEEQWDSPANIDDHSEVELDVKPFSQRKRTRPSEQLTGSWKVFEVSVTPIYGDDTTVDNSNNSPYVYLCKETVKKRTFPENRYFGEEEMIDMQDVSILWLPGVDISKDRILCVGVVVGILMKASTLSWRGIMEQTVNY